MARPKSDRAKPAGTTIRVEDNVIKKLKQIAKNCGYTVAFGKSKGQGNLAELMRAIATLTENPRDRSLLVAVLKKNWNKP